MQFPRRVSINSGGYNKYEIGARSAQTLFEAATAIDLRHDLDRRLSGQSLPQNISKERRYRHDCNPAYRHSSLPPSGRTLCCARELRGTDQKIEAGI
jgi:hypothetical protein